MDILGWVWIGHILSTHVVTKEIIIKNEMHSAVVILIEVIQGCNVRIAAYCT